MIGKLEGYKQDLDIKLYNSNNSKDIKIYNNNTNTNSNINTVNFNIVEETINNNESLTEEQTKEALEKLDELKTIYQLKDNRKTKWAKVKPILIWLCDKSVDIAIAFLPLITSIFGG